MIEKFIKDDGSHLICNGYCIEIYIPSSYFDSGLAENQGAMVKTFGILAAKAFDVNMKTLCSDVLNLPTTIYLRPVEIEDKVVRLPENEYGEDMKCKVIRFYKGDPIMQNLIQQDSSNVETFIGLMCNGNIPPIVPYNQLLHVWEKNLELNGTRLNVSTTILGIIISEIYRNKANPDEKFAKVIGKKPTASPHAYRTANIREICSRNSTFAAISFEDMDAMITASLNMKNYNKKQVESPIEKIIKM